MIAWDSKTFWGNELGGLGDLKGSITKFSLEISLAGCKNNVKRKKRSI